MPHWNVPEIPYVTGSETKRFLEPIVLGIPVAVFVGTKGMCDTFNRVEDWTSEVVCGIHLPLVPGGESAQTYVESWFTYPVR
jgi:hypothetical protein